MLESAERRDKLSQRTKISIVRQFSQLIYLPRNAGVHANVKEFLAETGTNRTERARRMIRLCSKIRSVVALGSGMQYQRDIRN